MRLLFQITLAIIIPLVCLQIWHSLAFPQISNFKILKYGITTKAYVTNVEFDQDSEISSPLDPRANTTDIEYDLVNFYCLDYYFILPNNKIINDRTCIDDELPPSISESDSRQPIVNIKYMPDDLKQNLLIFGKETVRKVNYSFIKAIIIGVIAFIISLVISYINLKKGISRYKKELAELTF